MPVGPAMPITAIHGAKHDVGFGEIMAPNMMWVSVKSWGPASAIFRNPSMARWRSGSNSVGRVPSTRGLTESTVRTPLGHGMGVYKAKYLTGCTCRGAPSRRFITPSAASPRWQSISCGVSVPQRLGVSGCSSRSRATRASSAPGLLSEDTAHVILRLHLHPAVSVLRRPPYRDHGGTTPFIRA